MNGNLFICEDNQSFDNTMTLNEILNTDYINRGVRQGLAIAIDLIEEKHSIKVDKEIKMDLDGYNFNIDYELCILSYKNITKPGIRYIDLKTGKYRELTDIELMICNFECCVL